MAALAAAVPPVEGPCLADESADRDDGVGKVEECADDGECHNLSLAGAASLPSTEPRHTPSHSHGGIVITYRPPSQDRTPGPSGHQLAVNWRAGPTRQGSSRIRPGVAAAPAAPPPAAPDRAGTRVQMRIGTVAAARAGRGHRPAGIGVGSRRPAEAIAIGHGNLLVITALAWGTANCAEGTRPLVTRWTPDAEPGRGYGHLASRERPGDSELTHSAYRWKRGWPPRTRRAAMRAATPSDGAGSRCTAANSKTQARPKERTHLDDSRHG